MALSKNFDSLNLFFFLSCLPNLGDNSLFVVSRRWQFARLLDKV